MNNEEFFNERKNVCYSVSRIPKRYLKDIALIPAENDESSFDRLKHIEENVINFINDGYNLYLYSSFTGNGKTTWACKIGKAYINTYAYKYANVDVFYLNVADYLINKKQSINNESMLAEINYLESEIKKAKLVIWDDIAIKIASDYDKDLLYGYINSRLANGKSNIFTSNILPQDLEPVLGDRLASRIINESVDIELVGHDRRSIY